MRIKIILYSKNNEDSGGVVLTPPQAPLSGFFRILGLKGTDTRTNVPRGTITAKGFNITLTIH